MGQKAVAQSQVNILNTVGSTAALDYTSLFTSVWEYVPRPTKTGTEFIEKAIDKFTDPSQGDTVNAAAAIIISEIDAIVDELVKRNKLKKA